MNLRIEYAPNCLILIYTYRNLYVCIETGIGVTHWECVFVCVFVNVLSIQKHTFNVETTDTPNTVYWQTVEYAVDTGYYRIIINCKSKITGCKVFQSENSTSILPGCEYWLGIFCFSCFCWCCCRCCRLNVLLVWSFISHILSVLYTYTDRARANEKHITYSVCTNCKCGIGSFRIATKEWR